MPCHWDAPDAAHYVIFADDVVDELRSKVVDAFLSVPERGAETGGFLLGRIDPAEPGVVRIEGFEEVPCEHRYGPSYVLSDGDRVRLREAIARRRASGPPAIVGLYRSYAGREPALDTADEELIRTYFPDPRHAFLQIKPVPPRDCTANFIFWTDGQLPAKPPYPPFSFDAVHLHEDEGGNAAPPWEPAPEQHRASEPATPQVAAAVAETAAASAGAPERVLLPSFGMATRRPHWEDDERETATRLRRIWLPLLLCVVLGIGSAFIYELWKLARLPQWTPLRLDAKETAGDLELNWDRNAPAVLGASRAVLSITDGDARKDIELSQGAVRSGNFSYKPSHAEVLFRLELFGGGIKPAGDSLRVMRPPAAAPAAEADRRAEPAAPAPRKSSAEPRGSAVTPPVPLHEVHPGISAGIRSRIRDRVVIPVEVHVNPSGRVTAASAQGGGDALHRFLADQSARAARSWRFSPARSRSGKPMAAARTIYFVYTRNGRS